MASEEKVYRPNKPKLLFLIAIWFVFPLFVMGWVSMAAENQRTADQVRNLYTVGGAFALLMCAPTIIPIIGLFRQVRVREDGITVRSLWRGVEIFLWSDIKRVERRFHSTRRVYRSTVIHLRGKRKITLLDTYFPEARDLAEELAARMDQELVEPARFEPEDDPDFTGSASENKAWRQSDRLMSVVYFLVFAGLVNLADKVQSFTNISSWWIFAAAGACCVLSFVLAPGDRSK